VDLSATAIAPAVTVLAWLVAAALLLPAFVAARHELRGRRFPTRIWHGGIATITLLWSVQATVSGQFTFHLLGIAGLALALGAPLALCASAVVVALHIALHGGEWVNAALVWLTLCASAVGVVTALLRATERYLAPNPLIYFIVVSFLGSALSLVGAGLIAISVFAQATDLEWTRALETYAGYLVPLAFGEATLTGMLITLAVVYRPQWVATFRDTHYLRPPGR